MEFEKVMERIRAICDKREECRQRCPFWSVSEGCIISAPDMFSAARIKLIEGIAENCTRVVYPKWGDTGTGQAVEIAVKMGYPVLTLGEPIPAEIARKCGIKPKIEAI